MDNVLAEHTRHPHTGCYRTVHARILDLYLPGSQNSRIPLTKTFYPPDIREQDTYSEKEKTCEWLT